MRSLLFLPFVAAVLVLLVLLPGCKRRGVDYDRPLAAGQHAVRLLDLRHWPDLIVPATGSEQRHNLLLGIERSLAYMSKPSSHSHYPIAGIQHRQVVQGLERLRELLASNQTSAAITEAIRREFLCYSAIGYDNRGTVLFTGYYTPIFPGSRTRSDRFKYPLYRKPDDLVPGINHLSIASRKMPDGRMVPYPSRAELRREGSLAGKELIWLADEFDAYLINVQGSGRIRLNDGSLVEVGYDGTNGHHYYPISDDLITDGIITEERRNLPEIRNYFRAHPDAVARYIDKNPRFIFFTETTGGPYGSLGQPVVPHVSVATDKSIFPRAAPVFLTHDKGRGRAVTGWRLDHDTGGAIRAAGRCDIYFGIGEQAEQLAGAQFSFGRMYYFVLR